GSAFALETISQSTLPKLPPSWIDGIAKSLAHPDAALRLQAVRTVAVLQLKDFDGRIAELAEREDEPAGPRLEALRALVGRRPELAKASVDFLVAQMNPQIEAVPQLARSTWDPTRPDGAFAMAGESIRLGWRPSKTELGPVFDKLDAEVRALIEKADEEQRARLSQFEKLVKGGDPARGREVFYSKKVACGGCHSVGQQGGRVGPDLTKIGAIRAPRDLLESILIPSSTFAQGYESYLVLTQDGAVLTGLLARQSADAIVLRDSSGN